MILRIIASWNFVTFKISVSSFITLRLLMFAFVKLSKLFATALSASARLITEAWTKKERVAPSEKSSNHMPGGVYMSSPSLSVALWSCSPCALNAFAPSESKNFSAFDRSTVDGSRTSGSFSCSRYSTMWWT